MVISVITDHEQDDYVCDYQTHRQLDKISDLMTIVVITKQAKFLAVTIEPRPDDCID